MEFMSNSATTTSTGGSNSVSQPSQSMLVEENTLWRHVTKVAVAKERGGNTKFRCNFCNKEYTGSYSRVKALKTKCLGIAVCSKVTLELLSEFQKEVADEEDRRRPVNIPLPPSSATQSCSSAWGGIEKKQMHSSKKRASDPNNPINKAYNMEMRNLLDAEIARGFYFGGLPFNYARNPHHIKSYTMASEYKLSGYVPPTYNALRTTCLQKERAHVERLMEPIKTWKEKGVTIVSDGWSDSQRSPLINFMAVTELGPMFIKTVNCEGNVKDRFFMANLIKEVIMEIGAQNVVQVITDNAPLCKAAGMIVETQYPHIFWTPCVVHTLNLALKNICDPSHIESNRDAFTECHWITEVADRASMVKDFILNHNMVLTMFNNVAPLKLLGVAETRFAR
ncbi:uncharacterized protein LOC108202472 [Daucus carota subsp. sativus]|uniref:uncharacterized protein LOC108202472 n=1 Tax=Daucus carota subsp. sativus TaxID=79200 RepID=UPI0007EFC32E|nr:PREDICTED: uncharacterized protein LOC108202472 [Daucus carota subsp. sativus]